MKVTRVVATLAVVAVMGTLGVGTRAEGALPGQNALIAFERQRSGGSSGAMAIWTMNPDGGGQAMLLEVGQTTTDPAWSPDMDPATAGYQGRIAFIADGDVWSARPDGGGPRNLTNSPSPGSVEREPSWSPDLDPATAGYQGRIAYASARSLCQGCPVNEDVYSMASTGGSELRLTEEPNSDREPAWSPDGSRIAFWTNRAITTTYPGGGLYVMDATGGNETRIEADAPDGVGTNAMFPNWSPDGSKIAVLGDANHPGIRVVDAASGTIGAQLTDHPNGSGGQVNSPAFSPQGDKVAFTQRLPTASSDFDIVVMNADGSNEVNLTASAGTRDEDPDWQPAGAPVDAVAPTVPVISKPAGRFQKTTSFPVSWSSTDSGSTLGGFGGGTYYVRVRSATTTNATFTPYSWWLKATSSRTATFDGVKGLTYCFSVLARDRSGNVSAWSPDRCTAVPLDDATIPASAGWTRTSAATGYYLNTYTASSTTGAKLTLNNARARRLALLVTKSPTAGTIQIAWNGTVLQQVNLTASTTVRQSLVQLAPFPTVQTGTVTVTVVSSGKRVEIDGLAVTAV